MFPRYPVRTKVTSASIRSEVCSFTPVKRGGKYGRAVALATSPDFETWDDLGHREMNVVRDEKDFLQRRSGFRQHRSPPSSHCLALRLAEHASS